MAKKTRGKGARADRDQSCSFRFVGCCAPPPRHHMEGLPTTGQKRPRDETSSEPPPAHTRGDAPAAIAAAAAAAPVPLGSPFPGAVAQTHATIYRRGAFFSDKT